MNWAEKYLLALKHREEQRLDYLEKILLERPLREWGNFYKDFLSYLNCEREECNLLIKDLLLVFEKYLQREKEELLQKSKTVEDVLYIYYFINRVYEALWRVKSVDEFLEELPSLISLVPFFAQVTYLTSGKDLCKIDTRYPQFQNWLSHYLSYSGKIDKPQLLNPENVPEYLGYLFTHPQQAILLIPIATEKSIIYLAFQLRRKELSEWERVLLLEELPSIFTLIIRLIAEKEEEKDFFDRVTGLPRQSYFFLKLEHLIEQAALNKESLLVGIVDIDKFTAINQVYGYEAGDEVLIAISRRLKEFLKEGEIGRGRGSSFIFAIKTSSPFNLLKELKTILEKPVETSKGTIEFTISLGGSVFPDDGDEPKILLRCAESALKEAKKEAGNTIYLFKKEIFHKASKYLQRLPQLKKALQENEFVLYCQPRINLKERRISGGEILVRWFHPTEGIIPPGEFIWILEESGLVRELGYWVLEESCKLLKKMPEEMFLAIDLSINFSPQQLREIDLLENLKRIFETYDICPTKLIVEITENIFIQDAEKVAEQIKKLSEFGVRVALDDFGTGYSSFRYLSTLPFHELKIDLIFVHNMLQSYSDFEIVKTIVSLGRILNKKVVAEGVETKEQLQHLIMLGVDEAQGYYFYPPLPWSKFLEVLNTFKPEKFFPATL